MTRNRYTVLGWVVWQATKWFGRRKARAQGPKLAAVVVVIGVIVAGLQLARAERQA